MSKRQRTCRGVPRSLRQGGATPFLAKSSRKISFFRLFDQKKTKFSEAGGGTSHAPPLGTPLRTYKNKTAFYRVLDVFDDYVGFSMLNVKYHKKQTCTSPSLD
jgi:hypothetical protein